ncbi:PH domain-containing protein [Kitasatospora sp. NPDC004799]|uniref:PH domain-containing protein n=1 Tax=Kitasatospora sp. NPDC004799 TaxID=3154460 RepID=UPI0033A4AC34
MEEMIFRQKDVAQPAALPMLALVAVAPLALGLLKLTALGTVLLFALSLTIVVPALAALRSWSRVGADGITVCRGFGPGRTYAWEEIRWIGVRRYDAPGATNHAVRIHLADGRRRSLPGLSTDGRRRTASFAANCHQVQAWWEQSTEPDRRIEPSARTWSGSPALAVGVPLALAVVAAFVAVWGTQQR